MWCDPNSHRLLCAPDLRAQFGFWFINFQYRFHFILFDSDSLGIFHLGILSNSFWFWFTSLIDLYLFDLHVDLFNLILIFRLLIYKLLVPVMIRFWFCLIILINTDFLIWLRFTRPNQFNLIQIHKPWIPISVQFWFIYIYFISIWLCIFSDSFWFWFTSLIELIQKIWFINSRFQ